MFVTGIEWQRYWLIRNRIGRQAPVMDIMQWPADSSPVNSFVVSILSIVPAVNSFVMNWIKNSMSVFQTMPSKVEWLLLFERCVHHLLQRIWWRRTRWAAVVLFQVNHRLVEISSSTELSFHRAEIPAANGITNARSLARIYAQLIGDVHENNHQKKRLISEKTLMQATKSITPDGEPDQVLFGIPSNFAQAGFHVYGPYFKALGPGVFGHKGKFECYPFDYSRVMI